MRLVLSRLNCEDYLKYMYDLGTAHKTPGGSAFLCFFKKFR